MNFTSEKNKASSADLRTLGSALPTFRLCYVSGRVAWFTASPISGEGCQWGDDWDDAPYEHNAGEPYDHHGEKLIRLGFDAPYDDPTEGHGSNSPYSVEMINRGDIAWLRPCKWATKGAQPIRAGDTIGTFIDKILASGGRLAVYWGAP